ncbi:hypothetical protein [Rhodospirillaceae bacterium SYSU D60014]|uniref:hypothetical protein n=1 Tax=Virgifigura deserti TaxID=2268457 RepID=UPI0013C4D207
MCAMPCPTGITQSDWESLVDACGRLLDRWGGRLSELGWTTADLFGMDARAPMARLDHAGLVRFLIGRDVVEVSADAVKLRTRNGGKQRLRRGRAGAPGQVPLWQLDGAL